MNNFHRKMKLVLLGVVSISLIAPLGIKENNQIVYANNQTEQMGVSSLESKITNMNIKGYVGNSIINNINRWQKSAYQKNPNIIDQIAWANSGVYGFGNILGQDYFNVDSYYDISIKEIDNSKALAWKLKSSQTSFGDRDFRYSNDGSAIIDWTGAKELWVNIDASEISTQESVRIAFEDDSSGRESYCLKTGANVYIVEGSIVTQLSVENNGFVKLPSKFKGYLVMPLNNLTFTRYWEENGNNKLDLDAIVQFQLAIKSEDAAIGKSLYMKEFAIVGNVNGEVISTEVTTSGSYKVVWNFENIDDNLKTNTSNLAWYSEFVGKLLTGIAYSYKINPDPELKSAAEEIINDLKEAQGTDGYLGGFIGGAKFSIKIGNWDLWNHYHCITGLLEWYKITGDSDALNIAKKAIDCIYDTFKDRSYLVAGGFETNRGIAHGYAQMYEVTKEKKYLDEAERIIMQDCQDGNGWYQVALRGGHFYQSSSNRWEVLHMIMTLGILYKYTANEEYYNVMSQIWYDILENDIHNTGGFTTNESAHGNPYEEGVIETCCSIAWAAFSNEFYKYEKTVNVADELERTYYNAILGSLLDNDRVCTYNSPMNGVQGGKGCTVYDGRKVASQQDISFQYNTGSPDMNCCQANIARGIGQLAEWAVVSEGNDLYLNYFGNSSIETSINNKKVTLNQETSYPLDGKVVLTISGLEEENKFNLMIRVPSWAFGSTIYIDGKREVMQEGKYFEINRTWKNGDRIELDIEESFTYWTAERDLRGYTSVYYGPILLTLDNYFSEDIDRNSEFSVLDFEEAEIVSGASQDALMLVNVKSNDEVITLVDYASAGKYHGNSTPSSYYSWINVVDGPIYEHDKENRWMDSDKIKVHFDSNIISDRKAYYKNEKVEFEVIVPKGKEIESLDASGLEIKEKEGKYYFYMTTLKEVTVTVKFKEKVSTNINDNIDENQNNNGNNKTPIIIGAVAVAAVAAGVIIKKKKED